MVGNLMLSETISSSSLKNLSEGLALYKEIGLRDIVFTKLQKLCSQKSYNASWRSPMKISLPLSRKHCYMTVNASRIISER